MNIFIFYNSVVFRDGAEKKTVIDFANHLSDNHVVTVGYLLLESNRPTHSIFRNPIIFAPWDKKIKNSRFLYSRRIYESKPDIFIYIGPYNSSIEVISLLDDSGIPLILYDECNQEKEVFSKRSVSRYELAWERELVYSQAAGIHLGMSGYRNSLPPYLKNRIIVSAYDFEHPTKVLNSNVDLGQKKKGVELIGSEKIYMNWEQSIVKILAQITSHLATESDKHYLREVREFYDERVEGFGNECSRHELESETLRLAKLQNNHDFFERKISLIKKKESGYDWC